MFLWVVLRPKWVNLNYHSGVWYIRVFYCCCKASNVVSIFSSPLQESFEGLLQLGWAYFDNLGCSPHLSILNLITPAKSLPCKVPYSWILGNRMGTSVGGGCGQHVILLTTVWYIMYSINVITSLLSSLLFYWDGHAPTDSCNRCYWMTLLSKTYLHCYFSDEELETKRF